MCGIAGIIAKDKFTIGELVRMTNMVRHRGPDDEGYLVADSPGTHPVCLGGKDTPEAAWQSDTKYKPGGFNGSLHRGQGAILDHRLVEFCASLPLSYLDGIGESKRILVHAMKHILPEKVRNRKDKQGFLSPDKRWVKKDNPDYFREKTKEAIQVTNGIVRHEALPYFDKIVSGSLSFRYAYLRFILFSEWIKLFNVK